MSNRDSRKNNTDTIYSTLTNQFFIIAGPCVIENYDICAEVCEKLKKLSEKEGFYYIFKSSYDKANRLSLNSFRGPGITQGLKILEKIKSEFGVPVLTDVHETNQIEETADIVDIIQIPAFLCRQTDLVVKSAKTGKIINIKKGQFMAPEDMKYIVEKVKNSGNNKIILTERGTSFGYHNLVVDFRSILIMKSFCELVIYDATHSLQYPGGAGGKSAGARFAIEPLLYASLPVGINGLFMEIHPNPPRAMSDSATQINLNDIQRILRNVKILLTVRKKLKMIYNTPRE
ncbi:MAG: 3-deoxy-8-phosphooctulonate synthase [Planctomycetota bacterium]